VLLQQLVLTPQPGAMALGAKSKLLACDIAGTFGARRWFGARYYGSCPLVAPLVGISVESQSTDDPTTFGSATTRTLHWFPDRE